MFTELSTFLSEHLTAVLAIAIGALFGVVPVVWFYIYIWRPSGREVEMLEKGWRGEATILQIWGTGGKSGASPYMGMRLEVRHPSGSKYMAEIKETLIPLIMLTQFQPGAVVPVKIAREDQNMVALDVGMTVKVPPPV